MNKNFKIYINQIIESISEIEEFTGNLTFESFLQNKMAVKAVSMNLLIIGENVKLIPPEIKQKYNKIPWVRMKSARNFLAHEYPKVEFRDLWNTSKCKLPPLKVISKKFWITSKKLYSMQLACWWKLLTPRWAVFN